MQNAWQAVDKGYMNKDQNLKEILEQILFPYVQKPMRYVGNELHCIKKDLSQVLLHGVLCFPEIYEIGMSHYGSQILYNLVNEHEFWALSRCYHPWSDAEQILREKEIPLYSLEYYIPLSQTDWLGFSIQYELQYTNIINMLNLAGIPHFRAERQEDFPIIIAGGPCVGNPEPLADFFDAFVIGDGEEVIITICDILEQMKKRNGKKRELLEQLATIDSIYIPEFNRSTKKGRFLVPNLSNPVKSAKIKELTFDCYPVKSLVPLMEVIHQRIAIEVMRGCTRGCRFCSAGYYYRPVRERPITDIVNHIEQSINHTGLKDVSLLSLSTTDYSCFNFLIYELSKIREKFPLGLSLPSTRVDSLTEDQVKNLHNLSPSTSFTLAPEAGSQRMRNVINKDFNENTIIKIVDILLHNNIQTLKLYFMVGLPTESDDDIEAIIILVEKIVHLVRKHSRKRVVHVSLSPFSPKAHTPFQWEKFDQPTVLIEKCKKIKRCLRNLKNVKVAYRDPEMACLETILARGDRRLSKVIVKAWQHGALFDGWDDKFNYQIWVEAARVCDISFLPYIQEIDENQELPWQNIDIGLDKNFLSNERVKARKGENTSNCRNYPCNSCGICYQGLENVFQDKNEDLKGDGGSVKFSRKLNQGMKVQKYFYRIEYAKGSETRFMGHRDIVNSFHRAFKAAKVPVIYSQGFHPHPRIAFGPPLPVGIMGKSEFFDIQTYQKSVIIHQLLKPWLPKGLLVIDSQPIERNMKSLNADIIAGKYTFLPVCSYPDKYLFEILESAMNKQEIIINYEKKSKQVKKDIKPLIFSAEVKEANNSLHIEAILSMAPTATCKPKDFIQGLFPEKSVAEFLITRIVCYRNNDKQLIAL